MIKRALLATAVLLAAISPGAALTTGETQKPLSILVDPDGTAYLWNTSDKAVKIDMFSITSPDRNLDVDAWRSFSEFDDEALVAAFGAGALGFEDRSLDQGLVGQRSTNVGTPAILPAGAKFSLGRPFATLPPLPTDGARFYPDLRDIMWGAVPIDIVYTPEPSTWLLAAFAGTALVAFRRRTTAKSSQPQ